ncbi:amidohydrolase family protein [Kyrpidia sp.]|uniref:amidohydrolase family protein n=1 Tax=Kyrpidia sp. TaxID=2073077 RepID=UPI00258D98AE|nr:amidohydrolase family protein [Kyrpidia sp.]MCL6577440.1 amidohydrolase family protein [Kyrpidia sp.]
MKSAIVNIGVLVGGDGLPSARDMKCIIMENGIISYIGSQDIDLSSCNVVVDADGATVIPGLIDSHVHIVLGDYTPRQKTVDFLESYVHGGITRTITASEVHAPGRPKDPAGVKALALMAQRCFQHFRPGGMTIHGGSVILEPGLTEKDFVELAEQGVWLAKAGFGAFPKPRDAAEIVRYAQKHGFKVMCHTGGASIPGSSPVTADDLLEMLPDISGHVNGGPTAMTDSDLEKVIHETAIALQIVQAGNLRAAIRTIQLAKEAQQFQRVLIASDTPTGTGMMPLGVMKSIVELSALSKTPAEQMIAAATGHVGRIYGIDAGLIRVGRPADVLVIDAPLGGSAAEALDAIENGDLPAIAACFTNGILRYMNSRNTPPPRRENIKVIHERLKMWI